MDEWAHLGLGLRVGHLGLVQAVVVQEAVVQEAVGQDGRQRAVDRGRPDPAPTGPVRFDPGLAPDPPNPLRRESRLCVELVTVTRSLPSGFTI